MEVRPPIFVVNHRSRSVLDLESFDQRPSGRPRDFYSRFVEIKGPIADSHPPPAFTRVNGNEELLYRQESHTTYVCQARKTRDSPIGEYLRSLRPDARARVQKILSAVTHSA